MEDIIKRRARDRQRGGQGGVLLPANSQEAIETYEELAAIAGVARDTIFRAREKRFPQLSEPFIDLMLAWAGGALAVTLGHRQTMTHIPSHWRGTR